MQSYVVRRCRPEQARDSIETLWKRNLQLEQSAAGKFHWLYDQAPQPPDAVFLLALETAGGSRRDVGTAGVGLREFASGTERLRAGLLADLAVDRDHRTVGPALRLVREVKAWALGELDLAYGFPNHHAQGVFRRVGYTRLGAMTRYARVLRHRSYLDRVGEPELARLPRWIQPPARRILARGGPHLGVVATALDGLQLGKDLRQHVIARWQQRLEVTSQIPDGIDALWERCHGEYPLVAVRSQRFLTWRYPQSPRRFWCAARRGAGLDAYAIIDHIDDVAHIRDLFGSRMAVAALLQQLILQWYRRGAASISMRYLGENWMVEVLRAAHFEQRDSDRSVFLGISPAADARRRATLADPSSWFLTDLDEDV